METNSRRNFLRNSSLFAIAILNPLKIIAATTTELNYPDWTELVEYARWCPNVHNLQPHRLKIISKTEAELYYEPSKLLPIGDPNAVFVTVAMGIFIEHLSIASAPYNCRVEIDKIMAPIFLSATEKTLFAKLKLTQNFEKEILNRELILKRRTSRLHYDGEKISEEILTKIEKQTNAFGHNFYATSDKNKIKALIKMNQQTLFDDLKSKENREELDKLFRYNKVEAENTRDGLWSKCMNFSGSLIKSIFNHHERWGKGLRKSILSNSYKNSFNGTATVCWIAGNFENTNDWVNAGKMLARNWLLITKENAYIQPFGSLITNENAYQKINEIFEKPENDKKIWMIFRVGYSKKPTRSFRLDTKEIIFK